MRGAFLSCVAWLAACSASTTQENVDGGALLQNVDAGAPPLAVCTVPDAGACRTARALLSCQGSNGVGQGCISDDPTQCPGPNAMPGVTFTCQNQCTERQYAVACGSVGGASADPPAGCGGGSSTPAGIAFYCCPCVP
jgi:hypothetical protein